MNPQGDLFEYHAAGELARALGPEYAVVFTANRRTVVSVNRRDRPIRARVSRIFTLAPRETILDLARFISGREKSLTPLVKRFIHEKAPAMPGPARKTPRLKLAGKVHDLGAITREIGALYFDNQISVRITWGRHGHVQPKRRARHSIRYGTYAADLDLVTIHPALDSEFVPRRFVEFVVYHEMLHKAIPPRVGEDGVARFHTRQFKAREKLFGDYAAMAAWEKANIHNLLNNAWAMAAARGDA